MAQFLLADGLIGHAHDEPDEKRGITASEQAVPPDRREKTPASR